jgi:hypothetical protein
LKLNYNQKLSLELEFKKGGGGRRKEEEKKKIIQRNFFTIF